MMGVYIRGMAMPTSCDRCPCKTSDAFGGIGCQATGYIPLRKAGEDRPNWCPLVPVPPHGDLIDYDFCMENYELMHDGDGNPVYAVRMRDINIAPTIIPAEEDTDFFTKGHLHLGYAEEGET